MCCGNAWKPIYFSKKDDITTSSTTEYKYENDENVKTSSTSTSTTTTTTTTVSSTTAYVKQTDRYSSSTTSTIKVIRKWKVFLKKKHFLTCLCILIKFSISYNYSVDKHKAGFRVFDTFISW